MSVSYIRLKSLITESPKIRRPFKRNATPQALKASLIRDGLLNPLCVRKYKNKFVVVDGKKRLKILQELVRSKQYARSFYKLPCISESALEKPGPVPHQPLLMSDTELVHAIVSDLRGGRPKQEIAARFDCAVSIVEDAPKLENLHPEVLRSFNQGSISLAQAAALTTIPNPGAQWRLLRQIGPFASRADIIRAIRSGETVLELPDGNTLILPTRQAPELQDVFTPQFRRPERALAA